EAVTTGPVRSGFLRFALLGFRVVLAGEQLADRLRRTRHPGGQVSGVRVGSGELLELPLLPRAHIRPPVAGLAHRSYLLLSPGYWLMGVRQKGKRDAKGPTATRLRRAR